jgi:hypothetical protein
MAFRSMFTYDIAQKTQDAVLKHMGVEVTVFAPRDPLRMQGYENLADFDQFKAVCFIDFNPKRRVFYHFNWFPEDQDQVIAAYFPVATNVAVDWFIRTKTIQQVSPYGDLLFKIVKIGDDGKYIPLKRTVFLNAVSDATMLEFLEVKE